MSIEICTVCPLGMKACEEIKNGEDGKPKIFRCAWYTCLSGRDPQTGKDVDDWKCAIAWGPIMSVEVANTNRGQTSALESFRNESIVRQDASLQIQAQMASENSIKFIN